MHKLIIGGTIFAIAFGILPYAFAREGSAQTSTGSAAENTLRTDRMHLLDQLHEERTDLQNTLQSDHTDFRKDMTTMMHDLQGATPEDRQAALQDMRERREEFLRHAQELRKNLRDHQQELRDEFRQKVNDVKTRARIAAAHGKGLRMLNRFRALIARFEHITDKLESRTKKLKDQGIDTSSVVILIAKARNTQAEAEATMEELKAKYESLLEGQHEGGIAKDAQAIAQTLKKETEDLHAQLRDIASAIRALQPGQEGEGAGAPESPAP